MTDMPKAKLKSKTTINRPAQRRLRVRPRGTAITVEDDTTWFYEYRGKIEIIHWCKDNAGKNRHASHIKIPWRLLMESARRCRPEEVKHPNDKVSGQSGREKASASGETQCAHSDSLHRLVSTRKFDEQKSSE